MDSDAPPPYVPTPLTPIEATLTEAARLAMVAVDLMGEDHAVPTFPRRSQRIATLLRCAAAIVDDLGGDR